MKGRIGNMTNQLLLTSMGRGLMVRAADAANSTSNTLVNSTNATDTANSTSLVEWASNATSKIGESSYMPSPRVSVGLLLTGLAVAGAAYFLHTRWHSASENNDVRSRLGEDRIDVEIEDLSSDASSVAGLEDVAENGPGEVSEPKLNTPPSSPKFGESAAPAAQKEFAQAVSDKLMESTQAQAPEDQAVEDKLEAPLVDERGQASEASAESDQKSVVGAETTPASEPKPEETKATPEKPTIEQVRYKAAMEALYPKTPKPITVRDRQNEYSEKLKKKVIQSTPEEQVRYKAAMKALYPKTPKPDGSSSAFQRRLNYDPKPTNDDLKRAKAAALALKLNR